MTSTSGADGSGQLTIVGGSVLAGDDPAVGAATVVCAGATIDHVGELGAVSGPTVDAGGAWVLPGIVDIHGDAFERSLMPRAGVPVDIDLALLDNDRQLLAAGITTSFLSATDSWEPGLRSRQTLRSLVVHIRNNRALPEVLLHVRHERCHVTDLDELMAWVLDGTVAMLSFNDHTAARPADIGRLSATQVQRSGVGREQLQELMAQAVAQSDLGSRQEVMLAEAARAAGCVTASHDASHEAHLIRDQELGVRIAEFPLSAELARRYRDRGISVVFGAPNLVRGGSHLGNLSVREALVAGVGDVLCSDYHYPSLLQAPFVLAESCGWKLGDAWATVAAAPAAVAGLDDRGRLEGGARADVIVVEPPDAGPARVRAVVVGGRLAYQAA